MKEKFQQYFRKFREFKWTKENVWAALKKFWADFSASVKKYTNIQTWKDSMIPDNPEYHERLKHFFIMVIGAVLTIISLLVLLFLLIAGIGAPRVRMPDLVNKDLIDAVRLVQAESLSPSFESRFNAEVPRYTVIGQSPSAGLNIRSGRKVTLIVSMGQDLYTVPDLEGLSSTEAAKVLSEANIPYQTIMVPAGNNPTDSVIGQNFAANTRVAKEKTLIVTITQNLRSGEYLLENFVRQNLDFTLIRLLNNRVTPKIIRSNVNLLAEDGIILAQSLPADTLMRSNSTLRLTVGVYARDQGERNLMKWGYIRYTFPVEDGQGVQEIVTNEEGSNIVVVTGKVTAAKFYRMDVVDELNRTNAIYERTGGEGSTVIRAFKYYGKSKVIITADGREIQGIDYE